MKIVIVGDGKVGLAITAELSREGHDLYIIDSDPMVLENSKELYDVMAIQGNGASLPVLRRAEADTADLLIAATSSDEVNMLACIIARKIGAKNTIARVRNPDYAEHLSLMQEELGMSMLLNPELSAATEIYHNLEFPSFLHRDSFVKGRVEIVALKINPDSPLCGIALHRLYKVLKVKILVCAVERSGAAYIPSGDFVLCAGDRIHITADTRDLARVIQAFGLKTQKVRTAMIIGGSRISYYLSKMLLHSGIKVTIIEKDQRRCQELTEMLGDRLTILHGDGSNQQLLEEEGIGQQDALITLTNMDEENVFISLYGSHAGVKRVITKVNRTEYSFISDQLEIESVITPKMLCALEVVRYVRAMAKTTGGSVLALHELVGGDVHALEFKVNQNTKHLNSTLLEMPIKKGILLACIFRKGRTIIPQGNHQIKKDDTLIVIAPADLTIIDLNDIFQE